MFTGEDYDGRWFTVFVPAGVLSQLSMINITDDVILEHNETFRLILESVSTCGVTIGNFNTSEIIVIDNDGKQ